MSAVLQRAEEDNYQLVFLLRLLSWLKLMINKFTKNNCKRQGPLKVVKKEKELSVDIFYEGLSWRITGNVFAACFRPN
jgi:hypothetical protein